MKITHIIIVYLIVSVLLCCPVFAVEDIFNTTGKIDEETVYGGVRFDLPDYYSLKSESLSHRTFIDDKEDAILEINWLDASLINDGNFTMEYESLKNMTEFIVYGLIGKTEPPVQSYADAYLYEHDGVSYYAELDNGNKIYLTMAAMPELDSIVVTKMFLLNNTTDPKYENDFLNMILNAHVDSQTPLEKVEMPPAEVQTQTTTENDSNFDWEKYGDAWSDIGNALQSIENDDIGSAFDSIGDAYQKLGELSN